MADNDKGHGMRRRGKGSKVRDDSTGLGPNSQRQSMVVEAREENSDGELDKPLIANEARQSHRNSRKSTTGIVSGANSTVDDDHHPTTNKSNDHDHLPYGRRDSDPPNGSLTADNNGAWNRLSCVSQMLNAVSAGCSAVSSPAGVSSSASNSNNGLKNTVVDVACAVIDKLPDFVSNKIGPNANSMETTKKDFLQQFRNAFVTTYNKHDVAHVSMVQELYRNFYAICCLDADPLVDVDGYLKMMAGNVLDASVVEEAFGKDLISSEYWKLMGFQGTNPSTDFRGGGCLSLLLLLHLFRCRSDLVRSIFNSREQAPNEAPAPKKVQTTTTSASSSNGDDSTNAPPDYHRAPPFFVGEMKKYLPFSSSQSDQIEGGLQFATCEYPFAIAAINVAMHLMLLLGVERNTTCLATTSNIFSLSARLAKSSIVDISYNDNGNCNAHDVPPKNCRVFLEKMIGEAESHTSGNKELNKSHIKLMDGFEHLCAIFEVAIAVMHNEWVILPPKDKNILFFNQVLSKARTKLEILLRHSKSILDLNKAVADYTWITH